MELRILWGIYWMTGSIDRLFAYLSGIIDFKFDSMQWSVLEYAKIGFAASLMILTRLQIDIFSYKFMMQVQHG